MQNKVEMTLDTRESSFGESRELTFVDKFGIWLSTRKILKLTRKYRVKVFGDFGSGYHARLAQIVKPHVERCVVVDVALSTQLSESELFETHVGSLPEVLNSINRESIDLVVMNSVLEHLDSPIETLENVKKLLSADGMLFINVPTWFGKRLLELLAFKLKLSPAEEMEDHRRYYSKRDLWLEIRKSGFTPSKIKIRRHKCWTNVYALVKN